MLGNDNIPLFKKNKQLQKFFECNPLFFSVGITKIHPEYV